MQDPVDALEVEATRCHICTDQQAGLRFVEAKEVDLTIGVVHITVQAEDEAFVKALCDFLIFS